jgi:hypothetical protein
MQEARREVQQEADARLARAIAEVRSGQAVRCLCERLSHSLSLFISPSLSLSPSFSLPVSRMARAMTEVRLGASTSLSLLPPQAPLSPSLSLSLSPPCSTHAAGDDRGEVRGERLPLSLCCRECPSLFLPLSLSPSLPPSLPPSLAPSLPLSLMPVCECVSSSPFLPLFANIAAPALVAAGRGRGVRGSRKRVCELGQGPGEKHTALFGLWGVTGEGRGELGFRVGLGFTLTLNATKP